MANDPSPDDVLSFIRGLMHVPAIKEMVDLDTWGKEQGLDSERRAAVVSAISGLITSTNNIEAAKEYVRRAAEVIAKLGPALAGAV